MQTTSEKSLQLGPALKIGVLGGGQLGRMMIQSAIDLDVRVEVMDPSADAPCRHLTHRFVQGDLNDADAVFAFGKDLDVITIEIEHVSAPAARDIYLLQRKAKKVGAGLGKTTGWIHRKNLTKRGVQMMSGVTYNKIDDDGLHISIGDENRVLAVDTIVICAGQDPERSLAKHLPKAHLIGGADVAAELDAQRAIDQGTRLALEL